MLLKVENENSTLSSQLESSAKWSVDHIPMNQCQTAKIMRIRLSGGTANIDEAKLRREDRQLIF
jgi:hypothetical protein